MTTTEKLQQTAVVSAFAQVSIEGDGWHFEGPAWAAWRIKTAIDRVFNAAKGLQTSSHNAVQLHAMGNAGHELARSMLDDDLRCGNDPTRWPGPHPRSWTDQLAELVDYADSLPQGSRLRTSAIALARECLDKNAKAG